jgi:DNA-binding NarL/FixJ family response regulator
LKIANNCLGGNLPAFPIRILIVDDYEPFRKFLQLVLQTRHDVQVVSEASDGLQGVAKAQELQPDLILLDIGLPKLNGIEVANNVRQASPGSKILFVSQENSAEMVREALNTGALGFVVKTDAGSELLGAIDTVVAGGQFVSSDVAAHGFSAESAAVQVGEPT